MTQNTRRTIDAGQSRITPITVEDTTDLDKWLAAKALEYTFQWLLLHAEAGVVWGELRGNNLALSTSPAALRWSTLHQARLFGEHGELFVWQGPRGPQARLIEDGKGELAEWIDERQLLWGNRADSSSIANAGFTPIVEGSQGIVHAPPIGDAIPTEQSRASLLVRHYIGEDEAGVARITHSRVVELV